MKKCPKCDSPVDDGMKKCNVCGFVFDTEDAAEKDTNVQSEEVEGDLSTNENVETVEDDNASSEKPEESVSAETLNQTMLYNEKRKFRLDKRSMIEIAGGAVIVVLAICLIVTAGNLKKYKSDYEGRSEYVLVLEDQKKQLENTNQELTDKNSELQKTIDELENSAEKQLISIRNAYEAKEWSEVIELADALHKEHNGTAEDKEAQKLAKTSKEKIAEAKRQAEKKEKQGYNTGITYNQLARTPDDYEGEKVKFSGEVVQVIEGSSSVQIRLAVNDDYDTILLGEYDSDIVSSRILEDDHITIYGTSIGTISYESTMGATITIPGVQIEKIDQ